jgi:hypothetical protein
VITAQDAAGHNSSLSANFRVDSTVPVLTVSGVSDNTFYKNPVTATFSATDASPAQIKADLDGAVYQSGTAINSEGLHALSVSATDCAGNASSYSASFTIDLTPPVISITGVENGSVYPTPVTPVVTVTDVNLDQTTIELDGAAFVSGTTVTAQGAHLLWVRATDKAGNESEKTVTFEIHHQTRPSFRFAVCALDWVKLENNARIYGYNPQLHTTSQDGDLAANGNVTLLNNSQVAGDVVAGGNADLRNNADIQVDLYLAGLLSLKNNARVVGQVHHLSVAPNPCECGYDLDGILAFRAQNNDNAQLLSDSTIASHIQNGVLTIQANDRIVLPNGIFYFQSIRLRNNARLSIATGAHVELYIAQEFRVENNADLSNDPTRTNDLLVVAGANSSLGQQVIIRNNADLGMLLYAPRVDLLLSNNTDLYGSLVVRSLHLVNNNRVLVTKGVTTTPPPLSCE